MNRSRIVSAAALTLALVPLGAATAPAARRAPQGPPPPPVAAHGAKVATVAQGVPTPTQFAFARGTVFVAGAGAEDGSAAGGLFVLKHRRATRVKGSPRSVFGIAWSGGTLYLSSGPTIVAASGWNGKAFRSFKTIYTGPRGFPGFNGIAIGPDGLIYAGVSMARTGDARRVDLPFAQSIVTLSTDGRDVRPFATGLRQPWMLTFAPGATSPLATALGQENLGRKQPPDYVIAPQAGDDYGFPGCNWSKPAACATFAKPISLLPAHSSPMGIGTIGDTLYVALFTGTGRGPQVVSLPLAGGNKTTPVLSGFAAPVVALGTHAGSIYAGDVTGAVYRVKP
jgi:glucose/arabinose dehydrogenase